jgi:hypothetical protein
MFTPEKHVALGIKAPGVDYKRTGYAYVEMTAPSLVGVPAEVLGGDVKLTSDPVVIRIGDGKRTYTAGEQVTYIERRLEEVRSAGDQMRDRIARETEALKQREADLAAQRQGLSAMTAQNASAGQAAVDRYNEQVASYNADAARLSELIARYNALVEVERYAVEHQAARRQVYERLRAARL